MKSSISKKVKTVSVREHIRKVPVSIKNPDGKTIVDKHLRHIDGHFLDQKMIEDSFTSNSNKNMIYPASKKIDFPNADRYDSLIAFWIDYFNSKLSLNPKLDPDSLKALIATESSFNPNAKNKNALGLTQVTKDTLKILQDLNGETKDFVFKDIKQKDLNNPNISVALAARWLAQKQKLAASKLKRLPTSDEVIMMYKGILGDKSDNAIKIMKKYRKHYGELKK